MFSKRDVTALNGKLEETYFFFPLYEVKWLFPSSSLEIKMVFGLIVGKII